MVWQKKSQILGEFYNEFNWYYSAWHRCASFQCSLGSLFEGDIIYKNTLWFSVTLNDSFLVSLVFLKGSKTWDQWLAFYGKFIISRGRDFCCITLMVYVECVYSVFSMKTYHSTKRLLSSLTSVNCVVLFVDSLFKAFSDICICKPGNLWYFVKKCSGSLDVLLHVYSCSYKNYWLCDIYKMLNPCVLSVVLGHFDEHQ